MEVQYIKKEIKRIVKKTGNGAHIIMPKELIGKNVKIIVTIPVPFICKNCGDIISKADSYSPEENVCINCYNEDKAIRENKCLKCGGVNPKEEYWGICEACWVKGEKEAEEKNRQTVDKLVSKLKTEGLIEE